MNLFNEKLKNSATVIRACTPCCPFDTKNLPHPQFNYFPSNSIDSNLNNEISANAEACCLSKLRVDCRIQYHKKKKKQKKKQRYNSKHSSQSSKRSISSASLLSPNRKYKKLSSSTNTNSHYISNYDFDTETTSSIISNTDESESSFSSKQSERHYKHYNQSANTQRHHQTIGDLQTSINNLTQLIVQQQKPSQISSLFDRLRGFFSLFKSSPKPTGDQLNEECTQILERHHLTKRKLLSIYHLFDKNETVFLNWLKTIMPDYFLPLLLNYVKHFDSISTANE